MAERGRKRSSTKEDQPKDTHKKVRKVVEEEIESDEENDNAANGKRGGKASDSKRKQTRHSREESDHAAESSESKSGEEILSTVTKSKDSSKKKAGSKFVQATDRGEAEKIIAHKVLGKNKLYLIKWKNSSMGESWINSQKIAEKYHDLIQNYIAERRDQVVALISHKVDKNKQSVYLVKWKDDSKGQTWELASKMILMCPDLIDNFTEDKAEKIIAHRTFGKQRQYLIKWKDSSTRNTWESATKIWDRYPELYQTYLAEENKHKVKAIIAHKRNLKKQSMYLVKWEDASRGETWELYSKLATICPELLHQEDQVQKIIAHKQVEDERLYLLKWKDSSRGETWEGSAMVGMKCLDLYRAYIAEHEKRNNVEAIISQKRSNNHPFYLVKWKRNAIGETWEEGRKMLSICPDLINDYKAEMQKQNEVEAILSHKIVGSQPQYLIKWKKNNINKTWEYRAKLVSISANAANLIDSYREEYKRRNEIEAIISHKKFNSAKKYLVKWKDHSIGQTWKSHEVMLKIAPKMLKKYNEKVVYPKRKSSKSKLVDRITIKYKSNGKIRSSKRHDGKTRAVYYDAED